MRRLLEGIDLYILVPVAYLLSIGAIIQFAISNKTTGIELDLNFTTQLISIGFGVTIMLALMYAKATRFSKYLVWVFALSLALLVAVQLIGVEINGSQRWVNFGGFQIQPTEIAKLGLIVYLARLFDTREATVNRLRTVLHSFVVTVLPAALILLQPDLGSSVVLFFIWVSVLYVSHLKLSRFTLLMVTMVAGVLVLIPFMAEYQQERLISYFNPEKDASGSSYNVLQAGIAIGSGGLTGSGLESGSQSQLNFLPSQHTDFIFAVIAEKLGLIGALSVIIALFSLMTRTIYLAMVTTSQFERGVLTGLTGVLFFHSFVNIGMNIGLVPVTGLPLPFLSYGGTFMVVVLAGVGLALSISRIRYLKARRHGSKIHQMSNQALQM